MSTNPFVGPEPFGLNNRAFFFGRDSEASQLLSLIVAHPVFLLYAQSGAGKTSLVNAKLIPSLEERGFEVLGPARVQGLVVPENFGNNDNIFVLNALRYLKPGNNNSKDQTTDLSSWLNRDLKSADNDDPAPRLIIFDQFEELFTFYGERWQDRKEFFEQVAKLVSEDPLLRVLFVMREDHVAELAQHEQLMPGKLQMRLRLERLRKDGATAAIREPLKKVNRSEEFATEIAKEVTDELLKIHVQVPGGSVEKEGEFVEAVQLQVVCHRMWENRWASVPPEQKEVTAKQRVSLDDIDWALTAFYEEGIRKVADKTKVIENDLRRWFQDKLITPAKTRGMVFGGDNDAAGLPIAAVKALQDLHLVRGDTRAGGRWYELTHDRFIEPILESNRKSFGVFETVRHALSRATTVRVVAAVWFIVLIGIWLVFLEGLPVRTERKVAELAWLQKNLSVVGPRFEKEDNVVKSFRKIQESYDKMSKHIGSFDYSQTHQDWEAIIQEFNSKWTGKPPGVEPIRKHDARLLREQAYNLLGNLVEQKKKPGQKTRSGQSQDQRTLTEILGRSKKELDAQSKSQHLWLIQKKQSLEHEQKSLMPLGIPVVYVFAALPTIWCLALFALVIYLANARGKLMIYKRILRTFQGKSVSGELAGRVSSNYGWVGATDDQLQRKAAGEKINFTDPIGWDVTRKVPPVLTMVALIVVMLVQLRVSLLGIQLTKLIGWNWPTRIIAGFTMLALICSILGICIWIVRSAWQGSASTETQAQQA